MTNGELLKAARVSANMTQKELAKKLNVSYTLISQYERGERNPKFENLQRIADALNLTVDQLLGNKTFSLSEALGYVESMAVTEEERYLIKKYRMSDERGRDTILAVAEHESEAHSVSVWDEYYFDKDNKLHTKLEFNPKFIKNSGGDANAQENEHDNQ